MASGDIGTKPIYGVESMDHSVTFRMRHEIAIGDEGIYPGVLDSAQASSPAREGPTAAAAAGGLGCPD